jgi:class 3 adenylate cyclase
MGPTDLHEPEYQSSLKRIPFYTYPDGSISHDLHHEEYSFYIYATSAFEAKYKSNLPIKAAIAVACIFFLVVISLAFYDWFVRRRDDKVSGVATVAGDIVSSLFPSNIRKMLFDNSDETATGEVRKPGESKPVACFFPEATVLYADISGFTAWSASRVPEQVFMLLETLYACFDRIAHHHGVYKVETIGDCYVAVTGLPDPQPLHAVIMTEFALECIQQMKLLIAKVGRKLGDDTNLLSMRFGLHSGPVTAGVLRGERARFQLFGETVNIESHIEHTGSRGRIHVSSATASYLIEAGKDQWLDERTDRIAAKGGGAMKTYWICPLENDDTEVITFQH